jgi:hypothetical protein
MRSVCDQRSSSREQSIELTTGIISIFATVLAILIMGGPSRPWSDRYLSSVFNAPQ